MSLSVRILQQAVDRTVQENGGSGDRRLLPLIYTKSCWPLMKPRTPVLLQTGQLAPVDTEEVRRHFVKLFVAATCIATQYSVDKFNAFVITLILI